MRHREASGTASHPGRGSRTQEEANQSGRETAVETHMQCQCGCAVDAHHVLLGLLCLKIHSSVEFDNKEGGSNGGHFKMVYFVED